MRKSQNRARGLRDAFLSQSSDEELEVPHATLADALETRVGGHRRIGDEDEGYDPGQTGTHQENSKSGMERARTIWAADLDDASATRP